jgi:hypothetical protein
MEAPLPELAQAERAEDFFEALEISYDRRIVSVHRLEILRLLGMARASLEASLPSPGEAMRRATLRAALREAHDRLARGEAPAPPLRAAGLVQLRRPGGD